jgi:hypothetical protein
MLHYRARSIDDRVLALCRRRPRGQPLTGAGSKWSRGDAELYGFDGRPIHAGRAGKVASVHRKQSLSRWILVLLIVIGLGATEQASGEATNQDFDGAPIATCAP